MNIYICTPGNKKGLDGYLLGKQPTELPTDFLDKFFILIFNISISMFYHVTEVFSFS